MRMCLRRKAAPPEGVGECVFRLSAIRVTSLSGANERWQDMYEVLMAKAKAKVKGADSVAMGEPVVVLVEMARGGGGQAGEGACKGLTRCGQSWAEGLTHGQSWA